MSLALFAFCVKCLSERMDDTPSPQLFYGRSGARATLLIFLDVLEAFDISDHDMFLKKNLLFGVLGLKIINVYMITCSHTHDSIIL